MRYQKEVVLMAAVVLACNGLALADAGPRTSLNPAVITADEEASEGLLMMGLGKAGIAKPVKDAGISIYGWIESGYTYNHRHGSVNTPEDQGLSGSTLIVPGPFNHEYHNHYMLNQLDLRFEKQVDPTKFEVGGMVELLYGSDAARMHATGLGYNGSDPTDDNVPEDGLAVANFSPTWQFDIPQAYVDIGVPIGNGLRVRVGKFASLMGYESVDPRANAFYSHSYLFSATPYTHVGVMGDYKVNDKLEVQLGVTRGWDIALEDNNGCAVDVMGQIAYTFNEQLNTTFNFGVGPENGAYPAGGLKHDSGHYRMSLDNVTTWQVTKELKLAMESFYLYDGGINGNGVDDTHHYGDVWGTAVYASYTVNDMLTLNLRAEKVHVDLLSFGGMSFYSDSDDPVGTFTGAKNFYEITVGATITPMPKDPYLKGLSIRPEIRYDFVDSSAGVFPAGGVLYKDQLTFGCDVIFQF